MKVITIGRSSRNDVKLIDSKVSRVHCQIIQYDNGSFAIIDFDSTNGTFVNDVRVYGTMPLKQTDRVVIGQTDFPWQQYFKGCGNGNRKSTLPLILAVCGGILLITVVLALLLGHKTDGGNNRSVDYARESIGSQTSNDGGNDRRVDYARESTGSQSSNVSTPPARTVLPDEMQIASDLIGHSLGEGKKDGYHPDSWIWKIEKGEVSDLHIISVEESTGSNYRVVVSMRLSSETRSYDCKALIAYKFDEKNGWKMETVLSRGMDIVQTHRYDDCISYSNSGGWLFDYLYAENNCEIALEVGGRICKCGVWRKFSIIVPPHEKESFGDKKEYGFEDYRIDYIERP